jgi:hypothetical protein
LCLNLALQLFIFCPELLHLLLSILESIRAFLLGPKVSILVLLSFEKINLKLDAFYSDLFFVILLVYCLKFLFVLLVESHEVPTLILEHLNFLLRFLKEKLLLPYLLLDEHLILLVDVGVSWLSFLSVIGGQIDIGGVEFLFAGHWGLVGWGVPLHGGIVQEGARLRLVGQLAVVIWYVATHRKFIYFIYADTRDSGWWFWSYNCLLVFLAPHHRTQHPGHPLQP